jgi:hypothetical protein
VEEELADTRADSFTSGFGDGYKKGMEDAKALHAQMDALRLIPVSPECRFDPESVLFAKPVNNGVRLFLGDWELPNEDVRVLKGEAEALRNGRLWRIMQETVRYKANELGLVKSKTWEETLSAKMMLHNLGLLESQIDAIDKATLKEEQS